jgi:pilus assembly protein CpaB
MHAHRSSAKVTTARFGALGLGAVALGCAALAAFFVGNLLTAKGYTGSRVRPIVVAKANLPAAVPLARADLTIVDWPEAHVPAGAFGSIDAVFAADAAPVPAVGILAGEPVVPSRLSSQAAGTGLARLVEPNLRAVALKVEDSVGHTGLVYPGVYVDVIVTIRDPQGRGPSSRIAVQSARVLSVGADTDVATRRARAADADGRQRGTSSATYVTLEVTPAEAEILAIARNEGELDLALRNGGDDERVETTGATPALFSAFASPADTADERGGPPLAAPEPRQASRPARPRPRRIQLRAADEPDQPAAEARSTPQRIETYYAN